MSIDSNGVLQFFETGSPAGLKYRNLSATGLSPEIVLIHSQSSLLSLRAPRALWSQNPSGNVPASGAEILYSLRGTGVPGLVEYGIFGPDVVPVPTSPWTNPIGAATLMTGVIEMGVIVFILGAVSAFIIKLITE
jgi:hypothetical protein